jgi:hypothetical protein
MRKSSIVFSFLLVAGCAGPHTSGQQDAGPPHDFSGIDLRGADFAGTQGNCNTGFHPCGTTCIPVSQCCNANDCPQPANSQATCTMGKCGVSCNAGFKECNGMCIGNALCCADTDCTGAHVTAAKCGTNGICSVQSCTAGYADVNMAISDGCECQDRGAGQQCPAATDLGGVPLGAMFPATGNLPGATVSNWFSITFQGRGTASWHPKIDLTGNPGMQFRMDVFADCAGSQQACGTETGTNATGITTWEVQQTGGQPPGPSDQGGLPNFTPAPDAGNGGTVKVHVFRSAGQVTCDAYTLTISN